VYNAHLKVNSLDEGESDGMTKLGELLAGLSPMEASQRLDSTTREALIAAIEDSIAAVDMAAELDTAVEAIPNREKRFSPLSGDSREDVLKRAQTRGLRSMTDFELIGLVLDKELRGKLEERIDAALDEGTAHASWHTAYARQAERLLAKSGGAKHHAEMMEDVIRRFGLED
jgi:hypothetical protein